MGSAVTIDAAAVLANIDRATDGAASGFYRETGVVLSRLKSDAVRGWPVDTGKTRAGFTVEAHPGAGELRSSVGSDGGRWPAYKQTWSRYSKQDREDLLERAETGPLSPWVQRAIARGNTPQTREAIEAHWRGKNLAAVHKRIKQFGVVPPDGMTKKQPWRQIILRPAQIATSELVQTLEGELVRLARGG